jgi:hypothetical protein
MTTNSFKKQIEDAEEIAALNLAKFRKAQQQLEEADERTKNAESQMTRLGAERSGITLLVIRIFSLSPFARVLLSKAQPKKALVTPPPKKKLKTNANI